MYEALKLLLYEALKLLVYEALSSRLELLVYCGRQHRGIKLELSRSSQLHEAAYTSS